MQRYAPVFRALEPPRNEKSEAGGDPTTQSIPSRLGPDSSNVASTASSFDRPSPLRHVFNSTVSGNASAVITLLIENDTTAIGVTKGIEQLEHSAARLK
jgi:hypothetical protein